VENDDIFINLYCVDFYYVIKKKLKKLDKNFCTDLICRIYNGI